MSLNIRKKVKELENQDRKKVESCTCYHCTEAKKKFKQEDKLNALWYMKPYYAIDDFICLISERFIEDKPKKALMGIFLFAFLDSFSTHTLLWLDWGVEGNILPKKMFDNGLAVEWEIVRAILVLFIAMCSYLVTTRGYTWRERASGKAGLMTGMLMFVAVVTNNLVVLIWPLLLLVR